MNNEEAVILAHRLRDIALHTQRLSLALFVTATPALLEVLETLIAQVNQQMGTPLSDDEKEMLEYLTDTTKWLRGNGVLQDVRTQPVQRSVKQDDHSTRQPEAIRAELRAIEEGVGIPKRVKKDFLHDSRVRAVHAEDGGCVSRVRKLYKTGT